MYSQWIVCCFIVCVLSATSVQGQESNSWWPFGSSEETETRSSSYFGSKPKATAKSSTSSSWFKWPSFSKSKPKSKSPSVVSRATKTSKKWWDNTADFMNPFNDSKPKPDQVHGYQSESWSERGKPKAEKSSGLFSWMWVEEKVDEPPSSVNSWQAQPRLDF